MSDYPYDYWQKCQTISGLPADLVISALQKEVRRNNVENATVLAYEMFKTSRNMEEYLWFRLKTISVEDVGMANTMAPIFISSLDSMRSTIEPDGDRGLFAIHAVRYLCQSLKDRSSDEMYCWIQKEYAAGNIKPEIPSYAIDKHTLKGQEMGKDEDTFYNEGSLVSPEWEDRDTKYKERIMAIIEAEEKEK